MAHADTLRGSSVRDREEDLDSLYRSWKVLDLIGETVDSMPPAWLEILNLARTLLEGNPLHGVQVPDELLNLIGPAEKEILTTVRTEHRRRIVVSPSDDLVLQPLRHIFDFDQITLPDLLLRQLDPELFEFRLVSGSINGQYSVDAHPTTEEWDELVEERIRTTRPVRKKRQKVYALLDVSNSMRDDNRAIFAKALVLAYLLSAAADGSHVYFRTFANTIHERSDSLEPSDFPAVARRVLSVTPDGGTDIKRALDIAIGDIRRIDQLNTYERLFDVPPTEILLVSDCESYSVPYVPPGIKLHTVHLKSRRMMTAYTEGFEKIREESTTFHEIDTSGLRLPDTARERWLLLQDRRTTPAPAAAGELDAGGEPPERRTGLLAMYERLGDAGARDARVGRSESGLKVGGGLPFVAMLLAFKEAFARAFGPLRHLPHPGFSHASPMAAGGTNFRVRR